MPRRDDELLNLGHQVIVLLELNLAIVHVVNLHILIRGDYVRYSSQATKNRHGKVKNEE
jgi:hypothetical protein